MVYLLKMVIFHCYVDITRGYFMFNPWPTGEAAEAADAHGFIMALPQGPGASGRTFWTWIFGPKNAESGIFCWENADFNPDFFLCKGTWGFSTAKDGDVIWSSRISWWNMVFHIREIMAGPVKPPNTEYDFPSSHWCRHLGNLWGIHKDYYFLILGIIWES